MAHPHTHDDRPPILDVILRGLSRKCPQCGKGSLYYRYLKLVDSCPSCEAEIGVISADDMPAYLTIVVVGHIIVPLAVTAEKLYAPPVWLHFSLWLPSIILLTLLMLPGIKGATVGLMWRLGLRGDERQ